jgi:hypothetical protein
MQDFFFTQKQDLSKDKKFYLSPSFWRILIFCKSKELQLIIQKDTVQKSV